MSMHDRNRKIQAGSGREQISVLWPVGWREGAVSGSCLECRLCAF